MRNLAACLMSLPLVLAASCAVARVAKAPVIEIRLLSFEHEPRTVALDAFYRAMRACRFYGGNPLDDLKSPRIRRSLVETGSTYGASCHGPGAVAPEIRVSLTFPNGSDQVEIEVFQDFSDAVVASFAAAVQAHDDKAIAQIVRETALVTISSAEASKVEISPGDIARGDGPGILTDFLAAVERRHGRMERMWCSKIRDVEPRFYFSMYSCFIEFPAPQMGRIHIEPFLVSRQGIFALDVEDGQFD